MGSSEGEGAGAVAKDAKERGVVEDPTGWGMTSMLDGLAVMDGRRLLELTDPDLGRPEGAPGSGAWTSGTSTTLAFSSTAAAPSVVSGMRWCSAWEPRASVAITGFVMRPSKPP